MDMDKGTPDGGDLILTLANGGLKVEKGYGEPEKRVVRIKFVDIKDAYGNNYGKKAVVVVEDCPTGFIPNGDWIAGAVGLGKNTAKEIKKKRDEIMNGDPETDVDTSKEEDYVAMRFYDHNINVQDES
ncbi:MAG: hypothetical protein RL023_260 [Candidatus Parcubacteria bacterium]|jgi:hypothetical protein